MSKKRNPKARGLAQSDLAEYERGVVVQYLQGQLLPLVRTVAELRAAESDEAGQWAKKTADYYDHAAKYIRHMIANLKGHKRRPNLIDKVG